MSGSTDNSSQPASSGPWRPPLLCPPATIVSPPSPVDATAPYASFGLPPHVHEPSSVADTSQDVTYDSPESDDDESSNALSLVPSGTLQRAYSKGSRGSARQQPIAAKQMSTSPRNEPSLLTPHSPNLSPSATPIPTSENKFPLISRAPSPSSPHFRPKPSHHRRTSSTHVVRETTQGEQRNTEDGERMVNQYRIGKSLGSGAYAKVELGVDVGTGEEFAIKEFSTSRLKLQALQQRQRQSVRRRGSARRGPATCSTGEHRKIDEPTKSTGPWGDAEEQTADDDPLGLIRREIAIMKKLDHPNIVHLYEAISVPDADSLFLVLEYLPGGVLMEVAMGKAADDAKPPYTMGQTREYFRQLCLGLEYLHANGVVHRDIKPENVLLSADRTIVKLCDFGVSEMFDAEGDDLIKRAGGSPAFLGPESFASSSEVHGTAVDVWALGVTLYCMLTGKLPFNVENPIELFEAVKTQEPELYEDWDPHLKELLRAMFQKDPHDRASIAQIRDFAWVTEEGRQPMISTEDNLYFIGKHVEEPTPDELRKAIGSLRSIFTVVRAVQKMRRLQLHRRSTSGQSSASNTPLSSPLALPTSSPGTSTDPSLCSGSMDSYASMPGGTSTAPSTDVDEKWKSLLDTRTLSPGSVDSGDISIGDTERQDVNANALKKLHIDTDTRTPTRQEAGHDQGEIVFDSPTSEEMTPVPASRQA